MDDDIAEATRLRNTTRSKTWIEVEELGRGSYGAIWLEREAIGQKKRAVKRVRRRSTVWDYKKELAQMAIIR